MYGSMSGVQYNIKKRLPKWVDWDVDIMGVHTMKNIADSIKLIQSTAGKECFPRSSRGF